MKKRVIWFFVIFLVMVAVLAGVKMYKFGSLSGFGISSSIIEDFDDGAGTLQGNLFSKILYGREIISISFFLVISFSILIYLIKYVYNFKKTTREISN